MGGGGALTDLSDKLRRQAHLEGATKAALLLDAAEDIESRDQRIKELEARLTATEEAWGFDRERLALLDPRTEQAIRGEEVSTRRRARSGVVHEMANLGVDYLCGRTATEHFNWTYDPVTCRQCLSAASPVSQQEGGG